MQSQLLAVIVSLSGLVVESVADPNLLGPGVWGILFGLAAIASRGILLALIPQETYV